jgi:chitin synthase
MGRLRKCLVGKKLACADASQENELWDKESNHSIGSWVPPTKLKDGYAESHTASIYGRETYYEPRAQSPAPSQFMAGYAPPGYQSGRNTPQSHLRPLSDANMLYQPSPSRPVTNYLDIAIPVTQSPVDADLPPGAPSDAELERAVQEILRRADLNSVTKREIRRQLEEYFGMDLTMRKGTINAAIDRVLLSHT